MDDGDPFRGFFSFELTDEVLGYPQTFFTTERSSYYRAITDLSFRIGEDRFMLADSPPHNTMDVRYAMTPPNPVGDALIIDADVVSRQYADALTLSLFFYFFDPSETWLPNGTLPPPVPNLATLSQRELLFRYQDATGTVHDRRGRIDSVSAVPVPEPTTGLLVVAGLASVVARLRFTRATRAEHHERPVGR
jgi:hypothetical protein